LVIKGADCVIEVDVFYLSDNGSVCYMTRLRTGNGAVKDNGEVSRWGLRVVIAKGFCRATG
jgi:hypothetical protein